MHLKGTLKDPIPRYAWRRVLNLWKPMAAWTLLVWMVVAIFLVPLFSSLLGWSVFRGDQLVVGNEELLTWLFTPTGFMYGLLTGTLALLAGLIRYAGLFQIVTDDIAGRPVSVRGTALRIAPLIPKIFRLCMLAMLVAILALTPLAAGLGGIYEYLLSEHDINYYLSIRPLEWQLAIILACIWTSIWLLGAIWLLCRSILVLPALLAGDQTMRDAVRESWDLPQKQVHRFLGLMVFSIGVWLLASITLDALFLVSASQIIEWVVSVTNSLRMIVLLIGLFAAGTLALGSMVGFLGFSFSATVLTKFYIDSTGIQVGISSAKNLRGLPARTLALARYWLKATRVIPLLVLLFFGSLTVSHFLLEQMPEHRGIAISAHRAGPAASPENTLSALEGAIASGAEYSEIDVQRTRDGVVVLHHDIDLMRVAGDSRRIAKTDYPDLRRLTPASGYADGWRLATLDNFLQKAKDRIRVMIELKYYGHDPELAVEVIRLVRKYEMEDEVMVMSLSITALRQLIQIAPDIPRGYVSALAVGDLTQLPVDFLAISWQRVNARLVRSAKRQEIEVYSWTVNRADHMADMMELGVNGIITDDPELAVRVRNELKSMTPAERLLLRIRKVLSDERN
ncbi:MAG: glycerophosphodiester phosphodiesterase family protein [Balneolales bacterium]